MKHAIGRASVAASLISSDSWKHRIGKASIASNLITSGFLKHPIGRASITANLTTLGSWKRPIGRTSFAANSKKLRVPRGRCQLYNVGSPEASEWHTIHCCQLHNVGFVVAPDALSPKFCAYITRGLPLSRVLVPDSVFASRLWILCTPSDACRCTMSSLACG